MSTWTVFIHRILAKHRPFEVCAECPQPATDRMMREARMKLEHRGER